jgi:mRNA interferase MazF
MRIAKNTMMICLVSTFILYLSGIANAQTNTSELKQNTGINNRPIDNEEPEDFVTEEEFLEALERLAEKQEKSQQVKVEDVYKVLLETKDDRIADLETDLSAVIGFISLVTGIIGVVVAAVIGWVYLRFKKINKLSSEVQGIKEEVEQRLATAKSIEKVYDNIPIENFTSLPDDETQASYKSQHGQQNQKAGQEKQGGQQEEEQPEQEEQAKAPEEETTIKGDPKDNGEGAIVPLQIVEDKEDEGSSPKMKLNVEQAIEKNKSKGNNIKRGDVFYADLSPVVGSEFGGERPVLIIQNDIANRFSPTVMVCAISTARGRVLPTHVEIAKDKIDGIVLTEQIRTLDKQRMRKYITHLTEVEMNNVDNALRISFGVISS